MKQTSGNSIVFDENVVGGISNTPPIYTEVKKKACFDWFTVTFDSFDYEVVDWSIPTIAYNHREVISTLIKDILGGDRDYQLYEPEYGRNNFKSRIEVQEGIEMQFFGPATSTGRNITMINITGHGCKYFTNNLLWKKLFEFVKKYCGIITRIDIAIDDLSGKEFTIYDVLKKIPGWEYTSIWRSRAYYTGTPNIEKPNGWDGLTLYFGKPSSNTRLVIYDKSMEQKDKGNELVKYEYWVRWEMRFSQDRGDEIITKYLTHDLDSNNFYEFVCSLLYGLIQFREFDAEDINKSRWPETDGYLLFLNSVNKIETMSTSMEITSLDTKIDWLSRSVFVALLQVYLVFGPIVFYEWIDRNLFGAFELLEQSNLNIMNSKNLELGLADFTFTDIKQHQEMFYKYLKNEYGDRDEPFPLKVIEVKESKYDKKKNKSKTINIKRLSKHLSLKGISTHEDLDELYEYYKTVYLKKTT